MARQSVNVPPVSILIFQIGVIEVLKFNSLAYYEDQDKLKRNFKQANLRNLVTELYLENPAGIRLVICPLFF